MSPQGAAGASAGVGALSSLLSGIGQYDAGQQQKAAYDYNAQIDLENTSSAIIANEQRYSAIVGRQASAYAAAGVDITSGSPLLMMAATAGRGGRQAEQIYQAGTEEATLQQYYGRLAAFRGTIAGIGTFLNGIGNSAKGYLAATGYQPGGGGDGTDSISVGD